MARVHSEGGDQVRLAQPDPSDEHDVGGVLDEAKPEQVLDLELIDFLRPGPVERFEGFLHRESSESDAPFDRAVSSSVGLAVDELFEEHARPAGLGSQLPRREPRPGAGGLPQPGDAFAPHRGPRLRQPVCRPAGQAAPGGLRPARLLLQERSRAPNPRHPRRPRGIREVRPAGAEVLCRSRPVPPPELNLLPSRLAAALDGLSIESRQQLTSVRRPKRQLITRDRLALGQGF